MTSSSSHSEFAPHRSVCSPSAGNMEPLLPQQLNNWIWLPFILEDQRVQQFLDESNPMMVDWPGHNRPLAASTITTQPSSATRIWSDSASGRCVRSDVPDSWLSSFPMEQMPTDYSRRYTQTRQLCTQAMNEQWYGGQYKKADDHLQKKGLASNLVVAKNNRQIRSPRYYWTPQAKAECSCWFLCVVEFSSVIRGSDGRHRERNFLGRVFINCSSH
jgi:hypothetical protein